MIYRITPHEAFSRSVAEAKKTYYRKNAAGFERLLAVVEQFLGDLEKKGPHCPASEMEPFPHGAAAPGWTLHKCYFKVPGLDGAAAQGRIIFAINKHSSSACPLLLYTHAEYTKRPAEKYLTRLLKQAMDALTASQKLSDDA